MLPKMSACVLHLRVFTDRFSKSCCWTIFAILAASPIHDVFTVGFSAPIRPCLGILLDPDDTATTLGPISHVQLYRTSSPTLSCCFFQYQWFDV